MAVIVKGKNARKPHTVRYWVSGRQRERSFTTAKEARDFMAKVEYESRTQTFIDPRLGSVRFEDYSAGWLASLTNARLSQATYGSVLRTWIKPWAADRTLAQVASDREGATKLINVTMAKLSRSRRNAARLVLVMILNEAVRAGRINGHRLAGIQLDDSGDNSRKGFVFPTYGQVSKLAGELADFGPMVWLMRGCGLRVAEALAVHHEDFSEDGATLRLARQMTRDGDKPEALKARKAGEYRDIPVPGYLWDHVKEKPPGPLCAGPDGSYFSYHSFAWHFKQARKRAGIADGFTPHSLRHAFASALLANGVPISDVAKWLGHRDINVTYKIYAHLIPSAVGRARSVLDDDFRKWSDDTSNSSTSD